MYGKLIKTHYSVSVFSSLLVSWAFTVPVKPNRAEGKKNNND